MANSIAQKLRIKDNYSLLTLNAPKTFEKSLGKLPANVEISSSGKQYNQVHWFVLNRTQMEKEMSKVMKLLKPDVTIWVYYPKGTSGIQTDLTRDKGWDCLLAEGDKLTWISLISFDDTWSTFGFRPKTEADKKKEAAPKVREIFNWVNPKTKEVKLPDDLAAALKKIKSKTNTFNRCRSPIRKNTLNGSLQPSRKKQEPKELKEPLNALVNNGRIQGIFSVNTSAGVKHFQSSF